MTQPYTYIYNQSMFGNSATFFYQEDIALINIRCTRSAAEAFTAMFNFAHEYGASIEQKALHDKTIPSAFEDKTYPFIIMQDGENTGIGLRDSSTPNISSDNADGAFEKILPLLNQIYLVGRYDYQPQLEQAKKLAP